MSNIFSNIIIAIFLIIIQGLFLNNVNFLEWLNPYIYLYFIIYFPLKSNRTLYITISFLYGLIIDFFSDMHAIHSAACLIIAYSRPYFLKLYFGMAYEHHVKMGYYAQNQACSLSMNITGSSSLIADFSNPFAS